MLKKTSIKQSSQNNDGYSCDYPFKVNQCSTDTAEVLTHHSDNPQVLLGRQPSYFNMQQICGREASWYVTTLTASYCPMRAFCNEWNWCGDEHTVTSLCRASSLASRTFVFSLWVVQIGMFWEQCWRHATTAQALVWPRKTECGHLALTWLNFCNCGRDQENAVICDSFHHEYKTILYAQ